MATIVAVSSYPAKRQLRVLWETLTAANAVGSAEQLSRFPDKTVQLTGTFDSATVVMQGSNDGTVWFTLTDPLGNALSFTAAGAKLIAENPRYVRPSASGGAGSQDVDVVLNAVA